MKPNVLLKSGMSGLATSAVNIEVTVDGHVPQALMFSTVKKAIVSHAELTAALQASLEQMEMWLARSRRKAGTWEGTESTIRQARAALANS